MGASLSEKLNRAYAAMARAARRVQELEARPEPAGGEAPLNRAYAALARAARRVQELEARRAAARKRRGKKRGRADE